MTASIRPPRWVDTGWGYRASSVDDLMRSVSRIGTLQLGRRYVWRGVPDWKWRVQSSLIRRLIAEHPGHVVPDEAAVRARERAIVKAARAWRLDAAGTATDQGVLAALQHHGAPTRLLDVTSNPMTALWFACQRAPSGRDASGVLLAFDVTGLEVLPTAFAYSAATYGSMEDPVGWHFQYRLELSATDGRPFLVEPTEPDARMRAQEGLFISGAVPARPGQAPVDGLPVGTGSPPGATALHTLFAVTERTRGRPRGLPFVAILIPPPLKATMRQHLETTYNRRDSVLFPDLAGFAKALNDGSVDLSVYDAPVVSP